MCSVCTNGSHIQAKIRKIPPHLIIFVIRFFSRKQKQTGFLSTGDESSPGNFGLKDQVLAMKWVKRNIKAFGGDPSSITLMGASAGAVSVHMHMLSPMSEGLFDRGIVMSGLATAPYNEPTPNPLALAKRQAEVVGIENIDQLSTTELVNKLREIDVSVLVNSVGELKIWSVDPITLYRPVIESQPNGAFMQEHPAITWSRGTFKHMPWMSGIVPNEGSVRAAAILTNKDLLDDLNANLEKLLPKLMEISPAEAANVPLIVKRLREYYLNGSSIIKQSHEQGFLNVSRKYSNEQSNDCFWVKNENQKCLFKYFI